MLIKLLTLFDVKNFKIMIDKSIGLQALERICILSCTIWIALFSGVLFFTIYYGTCIRPQSMDQFIKKQ